MHRRIILVCLLAAALAGGCASTQRHAALTPTKVSPTTSTPVPPTDATTSTSTSVTTTAITTAPVTGCKNKEASSTLDAELVRANGTPGGQTVPGSVYYGICDTTAYAVARFEPSSNATTQEDVSFQDAGAAPHYFMEADGQSWKLVGSASFPGHQSDCSTFTQLPDQLRTAWQDCPNG